MISLKNQPAEVRKAEADIPFEDEQYPWGARVSLEKFHLDQLNIESVEVGDTVQIVATAEVVGHHKTDSARGPDHENMEFQLTEIEITPAGAGDGDDDVDKLGDRSRLLYT